MTGRTICRFDMLNVLLRHDNFHCCIHEELTINAHNNLTNYPDGNEMTIWTKNRQCSKRGEHIRRGRGRCSRRRRSSSR